MFPGNVIFAITHTYLNHDSPISRLRIPQCLVQPFPRAARDKVPAKKDLVQPKPCGVIFLHSAKAKVWDGMQPSFAGLVGNAT